MIWTSVAVLISFTLIIAYWSMYNALVNARNGIDQSWSNIEVELKRRQELIGNLLEVVRGYAAHEKGTLQQVTLARAAAAPHDASEASANEQKVRQAGKALVALAEAYPNLKANESFIALQHELTTTENRIAERRSSYNQMVSRYQNLCLSVPSCLLAKAHQFGPRPFFDVPDAAVSNPVTVQFG